MHHGRKVFLSYSHKDEPLRDELQAHLAALTRIGLVDTWHDRRIAAGENWAETIDSNLASADIILFLVSSDFLHSEYCLGIEFEQAYQYWQQRRARLVPIILRACDWKIPRLAELQALPTDARPVMSWSNRDEAWSNVAAGIRKVLEAIDSSQGPETKLPTIRRESLDVGAPSPVVDRRRGATFRTSGPFVVGSEVHHLHRQMVDGYAWACGIHGIGKSTLVKHVLGLEPFAHKDVIYLDGRACALAYQTPIDALLGAFGLRSLPNMEETARLTMSSLQRQSNIHVVFDEIDAFPRADIYVLRQLFLTQDVGATIVSAHSPDFLLAESLDDDLCSQPPPGSEIELGPLPYHGAAAYFHSGTTDSERKYLARISGGNPTIMKVLQDMHIESAICDPYEAANRRWQQMLSKYFRRIWETATPYTRLLLVVGSVAILRAKADADEVFQALFRKVEFSGSALSLFPGDDARFGQVIVSPLFMAWVVTEHLEVLRKWVESDSSSRSPRVRSFGVSDEDWSKAISEISCIADEREIADRLILGKTRRRRRF